MIYKGSVLLDSKEKVLITTVIRSYFTAREFLVWESGKNLRERVGEKDRDRVSQLAAFF